MDPITLLVGAGILLAGALLGYPLGRRDRNARKEPEPRCGCTHHLAAHDPETLKCASLVAVDRYRAGGDWIGEDWKPCACRKYVGPMPTDTLETLLRMPPSLTKRSER